ncbi:MAG: class I SAM-dependent methyltransferase [Spirochaetales bacterium]|nr:class I SAM-dependent methyltransferase [Spirochaetales bacterium]
MNSTLVLNTQKLRGGYYTSSDITSTIAKWALNCPNLSVLEPSFGDGQFLKSIIERKKELNENFDQINENLFGVEIDNVEYKKFNDYIFNVFNQNFNNLFCNDFFTWFENNNNKFDVVVGNPPFIRYQNFPEPSRKKALTHSKEIGVILNKLTNIWVPFVVLSIVLLNNHGRLGMVIPAELLQVTYAGSLRKFLINSFKNIAIFTCNELLFKNAEQEVVIVLADGKHKNIYDQNIEVIETTSKSNLICAIEKYKSVKKSRFVLHSKEKWTKYFLDSKEIEFIRKLKNDKRVIQFGTIFSVDVGIVTGKNNFFVINKSTAEKYKLQNYIIPTIGRSYQIKNELFSYTDWLKLWDNNENVGLLDFSKIDNTIPENVKEYLNYGKKNNVNKGYKCSIRKTWYKVPSIWTPDAFLFRQIHDFPHLVINQAKAVSTDTIHRVKKINDINFHQVLFYTYLTAASAEIEGRSYGGGVLELEPTEAEKLLIPNPELINFNRIDYKITRKENGKFLKNNSKLILKEFLQFTDQEIFLLETIYKKLFFRRNNRKKC